MSTKDNVKASKKKPLVIVLCVIVALAIIYVGFGFYFNSHFYINSTVNGISTSFKSPSGAYKALKSAGKGYSVSFVYDDGSCDATIKGSEVGFEVNYDESYVAELIKDQNGFLWVQNIFTKNEYETSKGNSYDAASVKAIASSIKFSSQGSKKVSEDAYIEYDSNKDEFVIVDEVYGNEIDVAEVEKSLIDAIENFHYEINVNEGSCYNQPAHKAEDKDMQNTLKKANTYLNTITTYDLGVTTEVADPDVKATWFVIDGTEISFDEDAMGEFVNSMGEKYNTYGKAKNFVTTSGEEITIPAGTLGWKIAYQGEIDQIKADILGGENVTRDFVYLYTGASHGENDYGDSYVEVNLSEQHVYIYKEGEMVFDTDCVTGNVMAGNDTHTGAYAIAYKKKDATLRGADYTSFVNYWMPFHNGEGLHDATWRYKFGGTIYQGGGSHGCVNLPKKAAAEIYDIVDAGWPVLVFYTGDTEAEIEAKRGPYINIIIQISKLKVDTLTLENEGTVLALRAAYDALADEYKPMISNYGTLVAAEEKLNSLKLGIQ